MKLNEIDFNILSDQELVGLCLKYKLIEPQSVNKYSRNSLLLLIKGFIKRKIETYGQRKTQTQTQHNNKRRLSISCNLQKNSIGYNKNQNNPPRGVRQRRLSQPVTKIEKIEAIDDHNKTEVKEKAVQEIKEKLNL